MVDLLVLLKRKVILQALERKELVGAHVSEKERNL